MTQLTVHQNWMLCLWCVHRPCFWLHHVVRVACDTACVRSGPTEEAEHCDQRRVEETPWMWRNIQSSVYFLCLRIIWIFFLFKIRYVPDQDVLFWKSILWWSVQCYWSAISVLILIQTIYFTCICVDKNPWGNWFSVRIQLLFNPPHESCPRQTTLGSSQTRLWQQSSVVGAVQRWGQSFRFNEGAEKKGTKGQERTGVSSRPRTDPCGTPCGLFFTMLNGTDRSRTWKTEDSVHPGGGKCSVSFFILFKPEMFFITTKCAGKCFARAVTSLFTGS